LILFLGIILNGLVQKESVAALADNDQPTEAAH